MNVLPDSETIALECLRHYMADDPVKFGVTPPIDWTDNLPYCVVQRVAGGKSSDPRYLDQALLSVSVFSTDRKQSSEISRKVMASLFQAYQDQYVTSEGHIAWFQTTKSPVPVRDGLSGKHDDTFMFDATYTIWVRA